MIRLDARSVLKGSSLRALGCSGGDSGSVLITALLVIVTLVGLTVAFTEETGVEIRLAGYARDSYHAYQAARSGVHLALDRIDRDEDVEVDGFRDAWADVSVELLGESLPEDITFSGAVADESGKFNLNFLLNDKGEIDPERERQLLRLLKVLSIDETLAAPILDWLDADDIERMNGAENAFYQSLPDSYSCANGSFVTVGQLVMVKGFSEIPLNEYVTVYSDGLININTASKAVLMSLSEKITPIVADSLIAFRETADFAAVDDLKKVAGVNDALLEEIKSYISVKSTAFSIAFEGRFRDAAAGISAVAAREEGKASLIYWRVE